jgi:ABC-type branched-subunit amino acid transport system substrate-binding protein
MSRNHARLGATVAVMLMVAAACSSSKSTPTGSSTTTGTGNHTYTVGILTDLTGPAASGNKTSVEGVQAGAVLAAKDGYTIKYVVGDTATSPAQALSAAQKLVEQDHVLAVISVSALTFGAANYLTSQGIPVVGVAEDGPEWLTAPNMFSVYGPTDLTKATTLYGQFFKMEGATTVGALGYSISPSSAEAAKGAGVSAQAAGLKVGYVNANFPFGSTNVTPVALAMKAAGVNAVTAAVDPNTGFSLITALRLAGVNLKAALLPTGYGGDILQAGPGALQAGQNVYFTSSFEPIEMHTAATAQFANALKAVGITTDPTYAEYAGYAAIAMLDQGLKAAGTSPTHAALISALSGITRYDAAGLYGNRPLNVSQRQQELCSYITKLSGSTFELVTGADPLCGTVIPGKTISASS